MTELDAEGPPMNTFEAVLAYLQSRYPKAEVIESDRPPDRQGNGHRWVGIRFGTGDTCYVGVTTEAENHDQDLIKQLEEYVEKIAPGRRATVVLRDRSNDSRYAL